MLLTAWSCAEIVQAPTRGKAYGFINRLEELDMVKDLPEMSNLFRQFQAEGNRYEQVIKEIVEEERPPMISIKEYQELRKGL